MKYGNKTKKQLINELEELRQQIIELEASETERNQVEDSLQDKTELLTAITEAMTTYLEDESWEEEGESGILYNGYRQRMREAALEVRNKETDEELKKRNKDLEILNTITQAVHQSLDLEEVYKIALDITTDLENEAEKYFYSGVEKADSGDYQGAIKDFNKAIELNPKDAEAYYNRGVTNVKLGDYREAIEDFNKAIELNPKDAEAYYNRGVAKAKLDDYREAIEDFNKAIELNPKDAEAYYNRGVAKAKLDDYRGEIGDFNKAIEIKPRYAKAYNNRGVAKAKLGNDRGEIEDFNKAIEITPMFADAYSNRGVAKIGLGQKESGCLDLSKAGELGCSEAYEAIKKYCN